MKRPHLTLLDFLPGPWTLVIGIATGIFSVFLRLILQVLNL
ncbi:hypothetical protein [Spirosoma harenae]